MVHINKFNIVLYIFVASCFHNMTDSINNNISDNEDSEKCEFKDIETNCEPEVKSETKEIKSETEVKIKNPENCSHFACENGVSPICQFVSGDIQNGPKLLSLSKDDYFVEEFCYNDSPENKSGKYMSWFPNGTLESMGSYLNNNKNGRWAFYFPNGNKEGIGNYKDDEMDGSWSFWWEAGEKKLENALFKNGETTDYVDFYDPDGTSKNIKIKGNVSTDSVEKMTVGKSSYRIVTFLYQHNYTIKNKYKENRYRP